MEHKIRVTSVVDIDEKDEIKKLIEDCAKAVLKEENIDFGAFIDVTITDNKEIREINKEYREKDIATDVLSFPMFEFYNGQAQEELEQNPETGLIMLGDMVISYERALSQSDEYGHSPKRECGFLTVHSVLHLLGYDHERDQDDKNLMRQKEEDILTSLGLLR